MSCNKKDDEKSQRFILLTSHAWINDSLLADGVEEGGEGGILHNFAGETCFNEDGTGYVGVYLGNWWFNDDETQLFIDSDSLPAIARAVVHELTENSLKLLTLYPSQRDSGHILQVKMTFVPL